MSCWYYCCSLNDNIVFRRYSFFNKREDYLKKNNNHSFSEVHETVFLRHGYVKCVPKCSKKFQHEPSLATQTKNITSYVVTRNNITISSHVLVD